MQRILHDAKDAEIQALKKERQQHIAEIQKLRAEVNQSRIDEQIRQYYQRKRDLQQMQDLMAFVSTYSNCFRFSNGKLIGSETLF